MSPGFSRLVGDSICHKNYDPDDDAGPGGGDDVNEVHTGYIIYHTHEIIFFYIMQELLMDYDQTERPPPHGE